jgi:hypothetical protein
MRRRALGALLAAGTLLAAGAVPASAQTAGSQAQSEPTVTLVPSTGSPPPGRRQTARQMIRTALAAPSIAALRAEHPRSFARAYLRDRDRWQVSVFERGGRTNREIGQVILDDRTGAVTEAWTGIQVPWTMARGYPGAFGRRANALYIWLPLLALFLLPFLRPPYRLVHVDLAAVALLSVSFAFFDAAKIGASVPLAYPPLVYCWSGSC